MNFVNVVMSWFGFGANPVELRDESLSQINLNDMTKAELFEFAQKKFGDASPVRKSHTKAVMIEMICEDDA